MLKEKNEQAIFVRYCDLRGFPCVFIPNGFPLYGMKSKYAYINSLKAQGYCAGFPDIMVLAQNSKKDVIFFEFKREKGGRVSKQQQEWQDRLTVLGYDSYVAKGAKQAIEILEEWLEK